MGHRISILLNVQRNESVDSRISRTRRIVKFMTALLRGQQR